jgi:hypothetical protein
MEWQLGIVILVIAVSVLYLGRAVWRSWNGAKSGCAAGCGCAKTPAVPGSVESPATLIPVEQITLRSRETGRH